MFQSINYKTIIKATLLVGLFTVISFFATSLHSDGANQLLIKILYYPFWVMAFPFFYIFIWLNLTNLFSLILALTLDSLLYAFIIERLILKFKIKKANIKP